MPLFRSQKTTVQLCHGAGIWYLSRPTLPAREIGDDDRACASATITERLTKMRARLTNHPVAWAQELTLAAFSTSMTALGVGEALAAQALADPGRAHPLCGATAELSLDIIAAALERDGAKVRGRGLRSARHAVRFMVAFCAAFAAFAIFAVRHAGWPHRLGGARRAVALHAEAVNRTGHVRKALANLDPAETALLVIGRPRIGRAAATALMRDSGWDGEINLAFDVPGAFRGLAASFALAAAGPAAIRSAGYMPSTRELTAILFRILLGSAAAAWWREKAAEVDVIVYGHTGHADTILLEQAQQAAGGRTVHWLHGLSAGHVYTGISDLCVYQCGHDAAWHDRLGGYRRNISFPAETAAFRRGEDPTEWLVLTNFTHPSYSFFPAIGPAHELRLIELIAQAVDLADIPRNKVMWKPHPVFYQTDPETRLLVASALEHHGFHLWPADRKDLAAAAARAGTIISTPSGVAVDVLKLGRLPVIVEFHPIDPEQALALFPLRATKASELLAAVRIAEDPASAGHLFASLWQEVQPGRAPSFEEIVEATRLRP